MSTHHELSLPHGLRFAERKLHLPPGMEQPAWKETGRYLQKAREALAFWRADWLSYGRREFGDTVVAETLKQLDFDFPEMKAAEALNAIEERREDLSLEHHFVLASVPDAQGQQMWGDLAKKEDLTPQELQLSIRKGVVTHIDTSHHEREKQRGGVATLEAVRMNWDMLMRQLGAGWQRWSDADADRFLSEMQPIVDFCEMIVRQRAAAKGAGR